MTEQSSEKTTVVRPREPALPVLPALFGSPVPMLAYAVPVAASVLVWAVYGATLPAGSLAISNGAYLVVEGPGASPGPSLAGAVVLALAQAFGLAAATGAVLARLRGQTTGVVKSWVYAGRRAHRVLLGTAAFALAGGLALAIVLVPGYFGVPIWVGGGVVLVLAVVLSPLLMAWPLVVASSGTPLGSGFAARRLDRAVRHDLAVRTSLFGSLLLGTAALAALTWVAGQLPETLAARTLAAAVIALVAATAILLVFTIAASLVVEGLARENSPMTLSTPAPRSAHSPRRLYSVAVVAVLAPALLTAGAVTVNPTGAPRVSSAESDARYATLQTASVDAGTTLTATSVGGGWGNDLAVCEDVDCAPREKLGGAFASHVSSLPGGRALSVRWRIANDEETGTQSAILQTTVSTSAQLRAIVPGPDDRFTLPGVVTVVDTIDYADSEDSRPSDLGFSDDVSIAVDTRGDAPVIASLDRLDGEDTGTLRIYRCADDECTDAEVQQSPVVWDSLAGAYALMDLAVSPDGTAFVSVISDNERGDPAALALYTVTVDGAVEERRLAELEADSSSIYEFVHGTQVAVDGAGVASVLYRPVEATSTRLYRCTDVECSDWDIVDVSPNSAETTSTAMVIDSTGRPLIASMDEDRGAIVVRSCLDELCSGFDDRTVAAIGYSNATLALTLDADEHPIVSVADSDWFFAGEGETIRVIRCADTRCGAR